MELRQQGVDESNATKYLNDLCESVHKLLEIRTIPSVTSKTILSKTNNLESEEASQSYAVSSTQKTVRFV